MRIPEHGAKRILAGHGVPVPRGETATSGPEAYDVACRVGPPVAVKAQVPIGGRGKAGGIRIATTAPQAADLATELLGSDIRGFTVHTVLVEQAIEILREVYLSFSVDRTAGCPVLVASGAGGVDIEETVRDQPDLVARERIDLCVGLQPYVLRSVWRAYKLEDSLRDEVRGITRGLYSAFMATEATLVEINPLAVNAAGRLVALDAKLSVDDSAVWRHPELVELGAARGETAREREARQRGLSYVELDGNIGCLVNGAGLAMATMDTVRELGGCPANFLDIGGGARRDDVAGAVRLVLSANVRALLVNIFGGITRCDEVAAGLVAGIEDAEFRAAMVVRLSGTNEAQARCILEGSGIGIEVADSMAQAAARAVEAAGGS